MSRECFPKASTRSQWHQHLSGFTNRPVRWTDTSDEPRNIRNNLWRGNKFLGNWSQISHSRHLTALQHHPRSTRHQWNKCLGNWSQLSHSRHLATLQHHPRLTRHQCIMGGYFHPVFGPKVPVVWWASRDNSKRPVKCLRVLPEQSGDRKGKVIPCGCLFLKALDVNIDC